MLENLPVLGICGYKNTGKTTLIEQIVPRLTEQGLLVAVVKCSSHPPDVDATGKDTGRIFHSGADVFFTGRHEFFFRVHAVHDNDFSFVLRTLCRHYDIVLVEGRPQIPFDKVWLTSPSQPDRPPVTDGIIATLPMNDDCARTLKSFIDGWLPKQWAKTPVLGCVLIGGKSTRMGKPKHLILENGTTWLERTVELLNRITERVVIVGDGSVPESLKDITRLPDIYGINGPTAGILSAMRWAPDASFIVSACDLPNLSLDALRWILSNRRPGAWAIFPRLPGNSKVEPLLSYYDVRARILLEKAAADGFKRPSHIASHASVITVMPPGHISSAWRSYNTEDELRSRCPRDSGI